MPAALIPFPAGARVGFIRKTARRLAASSPRVQENLLAISLHKQRETMLRRRFPQAVVDREIAALEAAIRVELWRCVILGGSAA